MIFFHVIFDFSREIITSTVRLNRWYTLRYGSVILDQRPSTRGRDNLGNVSWTANMAETRSETGDDSHRGFQRFTEIGEISYSKCTVIKKTYQVEIWKMDWTNASSEENGNGQYPV